MSEPLPSESPAVIPELSEETVTDPVAKKPPPLINFQCNSCHMLQPCDYYGDHPPFAPTNRFDENCYVKRDPFSPRPGAGRSAAEFLLVLGADCSRCARQTCRSPNCSVFFRSTVCLQCAERFLFEYPKEIQTKIKKQIQNAAA